MNPIGEWYQSESVWACKLDYNKNQNQDISKKLIRKSKSETKSKYYSQSKSASEFNY